MVNPNELRIGNFVFADDISKIVGIHPETIYIDDFSDSELVKRLPYKPKQLDAIPLTEEWLLMFGFHRFKETWSEHPYYSTTELNWSLAFNGSQYQVYGTDNERLSEIKFVHQLQNLYSALTGKELELKKEPV